MGVDYNDLKKLRSALERFSEKDKDEFIRGCAKELAARLLRKSHYADTI